LQLPKFLTEPNPEIYLGNNYVVLDFETTTIGKGLPIYPGNRIVLAVWKLGEGHPDFRRATGWRRGDPNLYIRRKGEYELADLVQAIKAADFVIAHNAKFELGWLARCGLDLTEVLCYDTMLGEYVLGGNRWVWQALSLDNIAKRRYGSGKMDVVSRMIKSGVQVEDQPESWLGRYCVKDVLLAERIFRDQRNDLFKSGLLPVQYNRCLLTPVLVDIERNGMQLDEDLIRIKLTEVELEYAEIQRKLDRITGGINVNSPIQLAEYLYTKLGFDELKIKRGREWVPVRTDTGKPKTDAATIERLPCKTAAQREFVETFKRSKELYNELTKYLRKFADCCRDAGGLLLAEFNQTATRTHRLSSSGLDYSTQFQNFPRAYKPLFRARYEGWLVGECDGAQLEFRVAAHLGRDSVAISDIVEGTDIHSVTASVIGCTRQDAKPHTFKPLYGGQSGTEDEKRYYKFFREKYTGIAGAQRDWIDGVLDTKKLRTEWGLIYYWPDTRMDSSGYVTNTTSICNYPVQAFATAEIIPAALVWFWHRLKRSGLRMFITNTVHDSIVVELPPEEVEEFHKLSKQALINDVYFMMESLYGVKLVVPLGAGVTTGTHWGSKDETKYTARKELWSR
jgi:DNA polymerase I-like protein with 3'-5' exonuclease and polymerase domains